VAKHAEPEITNDPAEIVEKKKETQRREANDQTNGKKRKIRRRPGKKELAVDWSVIEREYVFGVVDHDEKKGRFERRYPSCRELAERHGLVAATVGYRARSRNWLERRKEFQRQMQSDFDSEVAKSRAVSTGTVASMLDTFIRHFGKLVEKKAIKTDTISDLERAIRLKKFVESEFDAADGKRNGVDLEELQLRHKRTREKAQAFDEAEFGRIPSREERERSELDAALDAKTNTSDDDEPENPGVSCASSTDGDDNLEAANRTAVDEKTDSTKASKVERPPTAARLAADAMRARRELARGVADPWRRVELRALVVEAEAAATAPRPRRARSRAA